MKLRVLAIALVFLVGMLVTIPSAPAASYGNYGSKVLAAGTDFNPTYAALGTTPTICSRELGDGGAAGDLFYLNMDGAGTTVAAFDVRMTTAGGFQAGTMVQSDSDANLAFNGVACAAFEANVRFLEADGLPGWTSGDLLYWSTDATLGAGDVRIAVASGSGQNTQSVLAGTVVALGDADVANLNNNDGLYPDCTVGPTINTACTSAAVLAGAGTFVLRLFDANLDTGIDTGDTLVLTQSPASTPAPLSFNIGDVYLRGAAFGSRVLRSSTDYIAEPEVICGTPAAITVDCFTTAPLFAYNRLLGADSNCDRLWIHFREHDASARVQMDDVVLYMPTSTLTSCASPPPTSSVTPGTRVTTAANGQGTAMTATASLQDRIFFVDVNGDGRFGLGDPVYLNRPTALGGPSDTLAVSAGDLRITAVAVGSTNYAAGTVVGATDTDIGTFASAGINNEAGKSWFIRKVNYDGASEIDLRAESQVKYVDVGTTNVWKPATDEVYIDLDNNNAVSAGDIRLHAADSGLAAGPTTVVLAGASDLTNVLKASTDFRVTGDDATFHDGRGESIYYSRDAFVNDEDYLIQKATTSTLTVGQVAAGCPTNVCRNEGVRTSDILYFSLCPTAGCPGRLLAGDVQVSPTMGTRLLTGTDIIPTLIALPTAGGTLIRYNAVDQNNVQDDVFYASSEGATVTTQDVRIKAHGTTRPAGSFVTNSDAEELQAAIAAGAAGGLAALIGARDVDGILGLYSLGDHVYVDVPPALGGGTAGVLSNVDIRITDVAIGSSSFAGGTMVKGGDADLGAGTAFIGLGGWTLGFFDDNRNGVLDQGDVLYALPPGTPALSTLPQVPLGAVRLAGPASTVPPPTTTAPPPPPPATTGTTAIVTTSAAHTTTAAPTDTMDSTATSDTINPGQNETTKPTPGLGVIVVIAVVAAGLLVAARRREDD